MSMRTFENADAIEITKNTVKFGNSVYQSKNVTGFTVGEIPKPAFPLIPFLISGGIGFIGFGLRFNIFINVLFLLIALGIFILHFAKEQQYGFILHLNSGQERIFTSPDKPFLTKIVSEIYKFMEMDTAGSVSIDMSNRSVSVKGDVHGSSITTGNSNAVR